MFTKTTEIKKEDSLTEENRRIWLYTNKSVPRALWTLIWPSVLYAFFFAFYNIADAIISIQFGANKDVSSADIRIAISAAFPIYLFYFAVSNLIVTGTSANYSVTLGKGDEKGARRIVSNGVALIFTLNVLIGALLLIFNRDIIEWLLGVNSSNKASFTNIINYANHYSMILTCGMPIYTLALLYSYLVRAEGYSIFTSMAGIISVFVNIGFDFLFIAHFKMSLPGAAWATLIAWGAQLLVSLIVMYFIRTRIKNIFRGSIRWRLDRKYLFLILTVGIAPFMRNFGTVLMTFLVLKQAQVLQAPDYVQNFINTDPSLAPLANNYWSSVYLVSAQMLTFIFPPVMAIVNSAASFTGYNFGASDFRRMKQSIKWIFIIFVVYLIVLTIFLMSAASPIASLFMDNTEKNFIYNGHTLYSYVLNDAAKILRLMFCGLFLASVTMTAISFYQSIRNRKKAIGANALRYIIFLIISIFGLGAISKATGVIEIFWLFLLLTDILTCIVVIPLLIHDLRNLQKLRDLDKH